MTLAETFLLLVFMLWYAYRPRPAPQPPTRVEILQQENDNLKTELRRVKAELAELERRLEWWRSRFDQPVPGSDEELKQFLFEAGRGKPKCQDDNVLVHVAVLNGATRLRVLADCAALRARLQDNGVSFEPGVTIIDSASIDAVLIAAKDFRRPQDDSECRFDYRFTYATYEDYYRGRERFERYFYTAGRQRAE
jgi:hypothetical protein